jgi:hypothetical protein
VRDEILQLRVEIAKELDEIHRLAVDWIEERIDRAEYDRRVVEPNVRLEALRARRHKLHQTPLQPLTESDFETLAADVFERRREVIDHREERRTARLSGGSQETRQAVADEVEWLTVRLEQFGKSGLGEDPLMLWADCRHCAHRITRLEDGGVWMHCDVRGYALAFWGGRGCRAASFDRDGDWNDALPRGKYAAPAKGSLTHVVPRFIDRPLTVRLD